MLYFNLNLYIGMHFKIFLCCVKWTQKLHLIMVKYRPTITTLFSLSMHKSPTVQRWYKMRWQRKELYFYFCHFQACTSRFQSNCFTNYNFLLFLLPAFNIACTDVCVYVQTSEFYMKVESSRICLMGMYIHTPIWHLYFSIKMRFLLDTW